MKKLLLITLLALSANVSAQWYEAYAFESFKTNNKELILKDKPIFAYEDNTLKILFSDLTIKHYPFKRTQGKYLIFKGREGLELWFDKQNKLIAATNIGTWYLKQL